MSFISKPVPPALLGPRPNGSYQQIGGAEKKQTLSRLQKLRLDFPSPGEQLTPVARRKIDEAYDIFVFESVFESKPPLIMYYFAARIAECKFFLGDTKKALDLLTMIEGGIKGLLNNDERSDLLLRVIEIYRKNNLFDEVARATELIEDQHTKIETHFQTVEYFGSSGEIVLAIRVINQYICPAAEKQEDKKEKTAILLTAARLLIRFNLKLDAKIILKKAAEHLNGMDYLPLEEIAVLLANIGYFDDAVHLLTDNWFHESILSGKGIDPTSIRETIIKTRFPLFAQTWEQFARR
ncbi:MAG: hypothetical protein KKC80_02825 [Candidatus Margulisbacteria bacterium]|nr:hypothetical protein [Candidatus Margulisiibacteriota bacterium]MBU1616798.1 hypothetical protein [Candidatus Margulisiibacteriota bacterium]MBU1867102.1 hypothetical protein [Candidatus Margulisiibacteriota bacterium]